MVFQIVLVAQIVTASFIAGCEKFMRPFILRDRNKNIGKRRAYNIGQHKTLNEFILLQFTLLNHKDDDIQRNEAFLTFIGSLDILFIYFTSDLLSE